MHGKLTTQLESSVRDLEQAGPQQLGDEPAGQGSGKPACMGLQHNAESHRGAAWKQGNHDAHESREVPEEASAAHRNVPQAQSATQKHGSSSRRKGTECTFGRNQTPTPGKRSTHIWKNLWERHRDSPKRRIKIEDLVRPSLIPCGVQVPQGRAPRATWREYSCLFNQRKARGKERKRPKRLNLRWTQPYESASPRD